MRLKQNGWVQLSDGLNLPQVPFCGDLRQLTWCVHCGGRPTTRDHVPSKCFSTSHTPITCRTMKRSRFSEEQIIWILQEHEAGSPTCEVLQWKAKFGGLDVSDARRLTSLEDENARLRDAACRDDGCCTPGVSGLMYFQPSLHSVSGRLPPALGAANMVAIDRPSLINEDIGTFLCFDRLIVDGGSLDYMRGEGAGPEQWTQLTIREALSQNLPNIRRIFTNMRQHAMHYFKKGANMVEILTGKRRKFRELAESRTNKAIESIARIGNLSNRQIYEWDEGEVKKIVKALREAVLSVENRFEAPKGRGGGGFKF